MSLSTALKLLLLALLLNKNVGEIIQFPQNRIVSLGENGTFLCSSRAAGITWKLMRSNKPTTLIFDVQHVLLTNRGALATLETMGIFPLTESMNDNITSELIIRGNQKNNFTKVQCTVTNPLILTPNFSQSPVFTLKVLGPPTLPSGHQFFLQEDGNILISWSPSFSPYSVPVTYLVEVKDGEGKIIGTLHTNSTSFLYNPPEGYCSILKFNFQAQNRAGINNGSILIYDSLARPNMQIVSTSIRHELRVSNGNMIACGIQFNPILDCSAAPVREYFLILKSMNESQVILSPSIAPIFFIFLEENLKYSYKIIATNNYSISSETEKYDFYTTDVQNVTAVVNADGLAVIQCSFISGSRSRGCYVRLMITGNFTSALEIPRDGGLTRKETVIPKLKGLQDLDIVVYDWEEDGSVGNLSVPVDLCFIDSEGNAESLEFCMRPSSGLQHPSQSLAVIISVAVVAPVILLLLLIIITLFCFKFYVEQKQKKQSNSNSAISGPIPYEVHHPEHGSAGHNSSSQLRDNISSPPGESTYNELEHYRSTSGSCGGGAGGGGDRNSEFSRNLDSSTGDQLYSELRNCYSGQHRGESYVSESDSMNTSIYSHINQKHEEGIYSQLSQLSHRSDILPSPCQTESDDYSHIEEIREYALLENAKTCPSLPRFKTPSYKTPDYSEIQELPNTSSFHENL